MYAARRSRWTRSATASACSSPASWSLWSAPAFTRATPSACIPSFSISEKVKSDHPGLYRKAGAGHRHRRTVQRPVHRGPRGKRLYHRGQSRARRGRCPFFPRRRDTALRTSPPRSVWAAAWPSRAMTELYPKERERYYVKAPVVLLLQAGRDGRLPVAGDEVHGRGHRL